MNKDDDYMAKYYQLIEDENNNWEVAIFLLIDHLHPEIEVNNRFSRTGMTSTFKALKFIENLLGPIGYQVNNTLENSISSAITKVVKIGYLNCIDGQCTLTQKGFLRLKTINAKYLAGKRNPIGIVKSLTKKINNLPKNKLQDLIKKIETN